jgi:hypothetical protein
LESIALAQRPGSWHSQPDSGPHLIGWNPNSTLPRTEVIAHNDGCVSAIELLRRLEESGEERRLLLVEWLKLLLERKELIVPLGVAEIILRRASDPSPAVAASVVGCLARLLEADLELGKKALKRLHQREDIEVRRALADVLTRMFRRIGWDAVSYLEDMLQSDDESVLAAASSTVGDLRFLDEEKFGDTIQELTHHTSSVVRRNLVPHLREYIRMYPEDERGILTRLWVDGDEVIGTRLRELLMRLEEVDPTSFSSLLHKLKNTSEESLTRLWNVLELRRPDSVIAWKAHLEGAEAPAHTIIEEARGPTDNMEVELPSLRNALSMFDSEE